MVNVSEGRDEVALAEFAEAAGTALLHRHRDPDHHRSVFTLAGPPELVSVAARALATTVVARLNLRDHQGAHPRLGALDVVPFVPYRPGGAAPGRPLRSGRAAGRTSPVGSAPSWECRSSSTALPAASGPSGPGRRPFRSHTPRGPKGRVQDPLPRLRPERGRPAHRRHRGGGAPGARGLQRLGLVARAGPDGRGEGPVPRGPYARPGGRGPGAGLVQPRRPGPGRPRRRLRRGAPPGHAHWVDRCSAPSWSASSPRSCSEAVPRSRHAELGLSDDATVEARLSS